MYKFSNNEMRINLTKLHEEEILLLVDTSKVMRKINTIRILMAERI